MANPRFTPKPPQIDRNKRPHRPQIDPNSTTNRAQIAPPNQHHWCLTHPNRPNATPQRAQSDLSARLQSDPNAPTRPRKNPKATDRLTRCTRGDKPRAGNGWAAGGRRTRPARARGRAMPRALPGGRRGRARGALVARWAGKCDVLRQLGRPDWGGARPNCRSGANCSLGSAPSLGCARPDLGWARVDTKSGLGCSNPGFLGQVRGPRSTKFGRAPPTSRRHRPNSRQARLKLQRVRQHAHHSIAPSRSVEISHRQGGPDDASSASETTSQHAATLTAPALASLSVSLRGIPAVCGCSGEGLWTLQSATQGVGPWGGGQRRLKASNCV